MKVSIAKALKLKNRLGARIKKSQSRISQWNSNPVDKEVPVAVDEEFAELMTLKELVREVAVAIYRSNARICHLLKEMAELKQHVVFLGGLNTTEGLVRPSRYSDTTEPVEYRAIFGYTEVEELKEEAEERIREIQDILDEHNAKTKIDIPDVIGDYK